MRFDYTCHSLSQSLVCLSLWNLKMRLSNHFHHYYLPPNVDLTKQRSNLLFLDVFEVLKYASQQTIRLSKIFIWNALYNRFSKRTILICSSNQNFNSHFIVFLSIHSRQIHHFYVIVLSSYVLFFLTSIGYPVVTLGFSLKSMISHHFRLVSRLIICICHLIQCTFVRVTH